MKRWVVMGLVVVMLVALSSVSFAGDLGRGRWQGFAIGLGAVTVYNLFEHGLFSPVVPPHRVYKKHGYHHPPVVYEPSGHWEIRKEWVPKRRERIWVPGHYENGYWVKGHYEVRIYSGYWVKHKIWVEDHYPRGEYTEYPPYGSSVNVER